MTINQQLQAELQKTLKKLESSSFRDESSFYINGHPKKVLTDDSMENCRGKKSFKFELATNDALEFFNSCNVSWRSQETIAGDTCSRKTINQAYIPEWEELGFFSFFDRGPNKTKLMLPNKMFYNLEFRKKHSDQFTAFKKLPTIALVMITTASKDELELVLDENVTRYYSSYIEEIFIYIKRGINNLKRRCGDHFLTQKHWCDFSIVPKEIIFEAIKIFEGPGKVIYGDWYKYLWGIIQQLVKKYDITPNYTISRLLKYFLKDAAPLSTALVGVR